MFLEAIEVGERPILRFDRLAISPNVVAARRPLFGGSHLFRFLSLSSQRCQQATKTKHRHIGLLRLAKLRSNQVDKLASVFSAPRLDFQPSSGCFMARTGPTATSMLRFAAPAHGRFWHFTSFAATHHFGRFWGTADKYKRRPRAARPSLTHIDHPTAFHVAVAKAPSGRLL